MKIGIVGLGIMGSSLAAKLLDCRQEVVVTNRTRAKSAALVERGATWGDTPAAVAAECDIVITLVTDPDAVAAVVQGPDGVLAALPNSSVHCDMSTVAPAWAAQLEAEYVAAGKQFIQAPVLGSKPQIEQSTLLVLAGGQPAAIEKCRPVIDLVASRIWSFGRSEQAATAKLACNLMIAHMILGLGQSMLLAKKGGVDPSTLLEVIQTSNLASAMYGSKGKSILDRSFKANFVVDNMLKDLNLAVDAGLKTNTPLPFASLAREMFVGAAAQGYGNEDYSAVVKVLEMMAAAEL